MTEQLSHLHVVQHGIDVNGNGRYDVAGAGVSSFAENLGVPGVPGGGDGSRRCGVVTGAMAPTPPKGGPETGGADTAPASFDVPLAALGALLLVGSLSSPLAATAGTRPAALTDHEVTTARRGDRSRPRAGMAGRLRRPQRAGRRREHSSGNQRTNPADHRAAERNGDIADRWARLHDVPRAPPLCRPARPSEQRRRSISGSLRNHPVWHLPGDRAPHKAEAPSLSPRTLAKLSLPRLPADSGRFRAYVELALGEYRVRLLDPATGRRSEVVTVMVF